MIKRALLLLVINIVVLATCAELLGLGAFYYEHGWLFYADPYRTAYQIIPDQEQTAPEQAQPLTDIGLHPYFGPIHRAGLPLDIPPALRETATSPARVNTNNLGFASPHDYPFVATADQFIVGIFGGSVAAWFCQSGVSRLADALKQDAFFSKKEIVPLCFSHEGYKQPQQLLVLAYMLSIGQKFDLVVNIDGFNEVTLDTLNSHHGWDISMPSVMHLDPLIDLVNEATLTPQKLDSLSAIRQDKLRLNALAARLNRNSLASVDFVLGHYYAYVEKQYRAEVVRFDALPSNPPRQSAIHVTPPLANRGGAQLYEAIARDWIASSTLMQQMLAARGVPYVQVLQPNQYYTTRPFSDAEKKVAFNAGSPFKEGAEKGYPLLEQAVAASGGAVNIFSGVHLFDSEPAPVYIDDCCHYTLVGYQHLADFIAASALKSPGPWSVAH